jgi:hypothetical protein
MKYIIALIVWIIPVYLTEPIIGIITVCTGIIIGGILGFGLVFLFLKSARIIRFIILS